jgi:hypothetical protein
MTRSNEYGENEITREAKREAARTGRHVCDILKDMRMRAGAASDPNRLAKIRRAEKYLGCRNRRRRNQ